ncbi:glycosyltransferase [Pseudomonas japonica]|uniref:glycosyltransferase n=1 Tax=Pseudomonas japonica TaxID=256466 RepID=UPI0015E40ACA|nr:glycosyltransferase [Pseudomonas japonica]MBA1241962.1 glycosyltransferase [Pseudomonas japonica]
MVSTPRVAVLMAAFNGSQWIGEQIDTILSQSGVSVELFISVDLCEDDTFQKCRQRAGASPRIHLLPYGGRFGNAAANFFRLLAEVPFEGFDLVALSDQDDHWLPGKLQRAADQLGAQQCEAYSSNVTAFWPDGRTRLLHKAQSQVAYDHFFEAAGPGCTYVFTKALAEFIKVRLTAEASALSGITLHDWYLYALVRASGRAWFIDAEPGLRYRQHAANAVGANVGARSLLTRYRRIQTGWWFGQIRLIAGLVGCPPLLQRQLDGGRRGLVWLAMHARQCRRRPRDRLYFAALCLARLFSRSTPR